VWCRVLPRMTGRRCHEPHPTMENQTMNQRALLVRIVLLALALLAGGPLGAGAAREGADLVVKKTADTHTAHVGDSVIYTITLTNRGPVTTTNVLLGEGAPDALGFTAPDCGGGTHVAQFSFACLYESLAKGETVTVTVMATITPDAHPGEDVTNTAFVAEASALDPRPRNNEDSATIKIVA
jgi:uncharacterized repeat protein (TIGR01451 family)